ncbi:MAG: hypothetical protein ABW321_17770 [Polyangiales bacterium]
MKARLLLILGLTVATGCMRDLGLPDPNLVPTAEAHVLGMEGANVTVPYAGAPVSVTLDGTRSRDPDGRIATYRWLSGQPAAADDADGGSTTPERWVPEGADPNWPDDEAQPQLTLDLGSYVFVLWVVDDHGKTSLPSTLRVSVERPLTDPAVVACVDGASPLAPRECATCVCGATQECKDAIAATSCNETCWGLIGCIADKCPTRDTTCIGTMCGTFLAGSGGATMLGPCLLGPCATECTRD